LSKTGYYTYYQDLLPINNKTLSNAFWSAKNVCFLPDETQHLPAQAHFTTKCMRFRFKRSTNLQCPLCHQTDSTLHILSGCQRETISNMITERRKIACRLIIKALSKGALALSLLMLGSKPAFSYIICSFLTMCLLDTCPVGSSSAISLLEINRPPAPSQPKPLNTCMVLRRSSSNISDRNTTSPATAASPKDIPENDRLIHLMEVKYCEDTRPSHQLKAAQQKPKNLCDKQLKGKTIVLHTILLGVGGSIYIPHTLHHFTELGLDSQRSRKLAHSLHEHTVQYAYKLSRPPLIFFVPGGGGIQPTC